MSQQTLMHPIREAEKTLGFAQAVKSGNRLYVSGTCSLDLDNNVVAPGDMRGQLQQIYRLIRQALEGA
jgi:enamine deaminase RidA (YjgF/YER057c/UK114 family)